MEDPSTRNSEYGKAAPTSLETAAIGADTGKARVSDLRNSLEKIPEATEKPHVKESLKGFRRLLKFGKKSHSPTTRNTESDNVSVDGSEADEIGTNSSSNEVHTLKNLISQDETPTASATQHKPLIYDHNRDGQNRHNCDKAAPAPAAIPPSGSRNLRTTSWQTTLQITTLTHNHDASTYKFTAPGFLMLLIYV